MKSCFFWFPAHRETTVSLTSSSIIEANVVDPSQTRLTEPRRLREEQTTNQLVTLNQQDNSIRIIEFISSANKLSQFTTGHLAASGMKLGRRERER